VDGACSSSCHLSGPALPKIEEGDQREGAAGVRASRLAVTEREEAAKGEGVAGAAFFAGARYEGGAGIQTRAFVRTFGR
jgi:hypothetical protein